jgi:hypothetical protein
MSGADAMFHGIFDERLHEERQPPAARVRSSGTSGSIRVTKAVLEPLMLYRQVRRDEIEFLAGE